MDLRAIKTIGNHTIYTQDNRFYVIENEQEIKIEHAWCDCRTLKQAEKEIDKHG